MSRCRRSASGLRVSCVRTASLAYSAVTGALASTASSACARRFPESESSGSSGGAAAFSAWRTRTTVIGNWAPGAHTGKLASVPTSREMACRRMRRLWLRVDGKSRKRRDDRCANWKTFRLSPVFLDRAERNGLLEGRHGVPDGDELVG